MGSVVRGTCGPHIISEQTVAHEATSCRTCLCPTIDVAAESAKDESIPFKDLKKKLYRKTILVIDLHSNWCFK